MDIDTIKQIERITELKNQGALTENEFNEQKKKILNSNHLREKAAKRKSVIISIFKYTVFIIVVIFVIDFISSEYKEFSKDPDNYGKTVTVNQSNSIKKSSDSEAVNTSFNSNIVQIDIIDLAKEYAENEVRTDEKYKDKIMQISGTVKSIDKDFMGDLLLRLNLDSRILSGDMYMENSEKSKMMDIKRGDSVIVRCKRITYSLDSPTGYKCLIVDIKASNTEPKNTEDEQ